MKRNYRFGNTASPRITTAEDTAAQPVTQAELETAGQQRLRLKSFSVEEECRALDWWARRLLQAEASAGNEAANRTPERYMQNVKQRVAANETVLAAVVSEWQQAKETATLDEPIWQQPATPQLRIVRHRAAAIA